jgi:hypothetical protein
MCRDCRLLRLRFRYLCGRYFADAKRSRNLTGFRRFEEVLEVAIFAEDIRERLFNNIIGASADEGGILIDLRCGRISESNGGADLTGLDDFE